MPPVLSHYHPVYQLYNHTITLYIHCTITQSPCIPPVLSHYHPVYQLYYHTITLYIHCTIKQSPCIPTVLSHRTLNPGTHDCLIVFCAPCSADSHQDDIHAITHLPDCTRPAPRDRTTALKTKCNTFWNVTSQLRQDTKQYSNKAVESDSAAGSFLPSFLGILLC
jgi:hypothetical protein